MPKGLNYPGGRKERVNMSTEQIEKWLNESSLAKEESKVEMESVTNFKYDSTTTTDKNKSKTINQTYSSSPVVSSHLSISPKIQHLVRPVNVTLSKLSDRLKKASSFIQLGNKMPSVFLTNNYVSSVKPQLQLAKCNVKDNIILDKEKKESKIGSASTPPKNRKMSKDSLISEDTG